MVRRPRVNIIHQNLSINYPDRENEIEHDKGKKEFRVAASFSRRFISFSSITRRNSFLILQALVVKVHTLSL